MTTIAPTDDGSDAPETPEPPASRRSGRGLTIAVVVGAIAVIAVSLAVFAVGREEDKPSRPARNVSYVVPKGTAEKAANGERVNVMPARVLLKVGDSITVRNDDTETATIGPFTVRPGEKIIQSFGYPQVLVGECSLSGTGEVKIIVT